MALIAQPYYTLELCNLTVKIGHIVSIGLRRHSANRFEIMDEVGQIIEPAFMRNASNAALWVLHKPNCPVDANHAGECFCIHADIVFKNAVEVPLAVIDSGR